MDKNIILKLMKSAECKCPAEINEYAQACVELGVVKIVDGQMAVNMKSVTEITDYIIQGNDPEIVSYIRKRFTGSTRILGGLVTHIKFNRDWRKVQSEWGRMYPYLKILTNGMYIPFNEEVLDCVLELLESFNDAVLMYNEALEEMITKCKGIPYTKVVEAIRRELGIN